MALSADPAEVYRSIGVTPIITASGSTTAFGGSKLRTEVMEAMNQAATVMVNIGPPPKASTPEIEALYRSCFLYQFCVSAALIVGGSTNLS